MIFPMIQRAKNDRSVLRTLPVYDNEVRLAGMHLKRAAKLLTVIVLTTKHAACRITFKLYPVLL